MIDPTLVDVVLPPDEQGYPDSVAAEDTPESLRDAAGDASRDFPSALYIEPRDRAAAALEAEIKKTRALDYIDRFTNQHPTHECTCHSLSRGYEACRNRQRGVSYGGPVAGQRLEASAEYGAVWVSPLSVYAEANPRQWGGASVRGVLSIATKRGFLPDKIQPRDYGFQHTLHGTTGKGGINQSNGPWTPVSRFPAGWQETAKHFRPLEVIFPEDWEQIVCLVLHGYVVCVGREGHAVPYTHWNDAEQLMGYTDSYDVIRWDSVRRIKAAVGGAFAIASVTTPDDWSQPAGQIVA